MAASLQALIVGEALVAVVVSRNQVRSCLEQELTKFSSGQVVEDSSHRLAHPHRFWVNDT